MSRKNYTVSQKTSTIIFSRPYLVRSRYCYTVASVVVVVVCRLYIFYRGPVHSLFAPRMYINILRTLVGKQIFLRSVIGNRTSQNRSVLSVKSVQL